MGEIQKEQKYGILWLDIRRASKCEDLLEQIYMLL